MRYLRSLSRNLRSSILITFFVLLFFSFGLVGIAFTIAARQYTGAMVQSALHDAMSAHHEGVDFDPATGMFLAHVRAQGHEVNFLHRNLGHFMVDADFRLGGTMAVDSATMNNITRVLEADNTDLTGMLPRRISTEGSVYYVAAVINLDSLPSYYTIYYVDVSDINHLTAGFNFRLLMLVGIIGFATLLMSTYLAGSLAKPLRSLSVFAQQIGQGDFTPNPVSFSNEEFEELNKSLNHAAKQLAKYDNDQKTFFQNVSHELRTPLMAIKSYAEGIKYGVMEPDKATETILECTNRLTNMVDDILYVSRMDNITPPMMEEVNFVALVEERIARLNHMTQAKDLTIKLDSASESILVSCVISYIERAVDNLISNAMRHAKNSIVIEVFTQDTWAIIRIMDDGPGFEPDKLPHVFERFYKGKNGLTGIGLSIVKSVVEQHKGTATAENGETGAVLTISLPTET